MGDPSRRRTAVSRRGLLALAAAGAAGLAGCGYRPGGGDFRWEVETGTGPFRPDDVLATRGSGGSRESPTPGTVFTVNRSQRGYDFDAEEWGENAEIAAYDPASGDERWTETTDPSGPPVAGGGRLYLGHDDGGLTALDADGSVGWEASLDDFPRWLAASDGRAYALTDAGRLTAFRASDGRRLWGTAASPEFGHVLTPTGDGVVVVADAEGTADAEAADAENTADAEDAEDTADADATTSMVAFDRDGGRRWSAELPAGVASGRPAVGGDALFVPGGGRLVALALSDGSRKWSRSVDRLRGSPAVDDDTVYHVEGRSLVARAAANGEVRWRFDSPEDGVAPTAAVAPGAVYVAGDGSLRAVSADDGNVRWAVETGDVAAGPLVVGKTVVVATGEGVVRGHRRE